MNNPHIAASPTNEAIFARAVLKSGTWAVVKQDLTTEALVAIAEHWLKFGKPIEISTAGGKPEYRTTVERYAANTIKF